DLVLEWTPAVGREPRAVYYTEEIDGETYGLLMVMPPDAPDAASSRLPRETTFIIDTSGSMEGTSIVQARQALLLALDRLQPSDWFNVIEFNSEAKALFATSVQAHAAAIHQARSYVRNLKADGGTNMLPALQAGLKAGGAPSGLVRQVIFATDGQVQDEAAALQFLQSNLGDRRLFTMAIGAAPNSHFLRKVAEFGRGSFTHIANESEVASRMGALFSQLESPMLHRIEVQWSDAGAEAWPSRVPDLYLGEPLVVAAKMKGDGPVTVSGQRGKSTWEDSFPAPAVIKGAGIDKLWARRKIQALEDSIKDSADLNTVRQQVIDLGTRHHLVTTWTSLVAVDESPTAPAGLEPIQKVLPVNAPESAPQYITVTAEAPLLDERRISTGATVSQTELENIPAMESLLVPDMMMMTTVAIPPPCSGVLDTTKARAHRVKAEAFVKAGKLKKAEAEYIQALVYDPTDEETWLGLEALGQLAGFAVDRQAMGECPDASVEAMGRFIRTVVIVR
ncbi:MAG TPA: VWA domain-containing protein, partial [Thermoanaerobaculia bacterium]